MGIRRARGFPQGHGVEPSPAVAASLAPQRSWQVIERLASVASRPAV